MTTKTKDIKPNKVSKKGIVHDGRSVIKKIVPKRAVKKSKAVSATTVKGNNFQEVIFHDEIDIPQLRKVEPYCFDCFDSEFDGCSNHKKKEWPNWFTITFLVLGILFVMAYCTGIERAAGM